ncbi:MAG TPA: leucine--tRNA ligase, partial [Anaerolineae bacterium]|nr:leucine--tRNA ligase [Anaerolineae bacterium]
MAVPAHDERDFEFALKFGLPIIPVIERPDRMAKSLVRVGAMQEGFAPALNAADISFEEEDDVLYVTLQGHEQIEHYVKLAQEHIRPGHRTEVIGTGWVFIFDDSVVPFDSVESEATILARCRALDPTITDARTVMELLHRQPFYRDLLFHAEYGDMINSDEFTGTSGDGAKQKVTQWLEEKGIGKFAVNYHLRDWLISRQRYWGAPIPMIHCPDCGVVPVPYEDLPVLLPNDAEFLPTGESPLKYHEGFRKVKCPRCGADAERETDTMDTFMCSSWYHYAYVSPYWKAGEKIGPNDTPWDSERGEYWLPVDQYTGGIEHATMHLLYTRFFTKALRDMGLVDFDEPMLRLFNQGIILGPDGNRMSKSRGNVIAPDPLVRQYGADTVRAYLMFIGPWDQGGPWNPQGIEGVHRFLHRVWNVVVGEKQEGKPAQADISERDLRRATHQTIKKVTSDYESFKFNTMIAALMSFTNTLVKAKSTALYGTDAWNEAVDDL